MKQCTIEIYGQNELVERIQNDYELTSHLVSIGNPGKLASHRLDTVIPPIFKKKFDSILRLEFFDVEKKSHLGKIRPKRIPKRKDVRKAIKYFKRHSPKATGFTIHCWRGVSRSTAIALGYLFLIYQNEQKAIDKLVELRPEAAPHPLIVSFFDELVGSNLTSYSDQLRKIQFRKMKEWFFNEIDDGDALLEELTEVIDDD